MIVLHHPDTLLHETVELLGARTIPALESPDRIKAIISSVQKSCHDMLVPEDLLTTGTTLPSLLELIQDTHDAGYVKHLQEAFHDWLQAGLITQTESILPECFVFPNTARAKPVVPKDIYARAGFYSFDMSSSIMEKTYIATVASANLAMQATELVLGDKTVPVAFALCRPPGHHCDGFRAGGYCYVNNAAVAISRWKKDFPKSRVGILDIDFHHGNGTQEIYYNDPDVFYASIHGEDEFPYYTGLEDETGGHVAPGSNLNLPLKTGSPFEEYMQHLRQALDALVDFKPAFLLVSLGFDTFRLDPLGKFDIDTPDYHTMALAIRQQLPHIPSVILLEGGYVLEHLGANVLSFIEGWESASNGITSASPRRNSKTYSNSVQ